jgi:hypothetical protein
MSDYYTHRDRDRPGHKPAYPDYADTGTGGTWLWVAIVGLAIVALIGAGLAGGGGETNPEGAAVEAVPAAPEATAPAIPAD